MKDTAPSHAQSLISVVLPVYNEAENIGSCLRKLWAVLKEVPHEVLVCYDFDADTTLGAIRQMTDCPQTVRLVKNDLGRGVAYALQAGFSAAKGDAIITTMADLSDPPEVIPAMAAKIRAGADVVSGSRYMKGGSQRGGPLLKRTLSRCAGLSLCWVAGVNTHDATNNFRAYSTRFLRAIQVESRSGFEVAIELTTKAHRLGFKVDEVPSSWQDRSAGQSRFRMWKWLPRYLAWYVQAMAAPVVVWSAWLAMLSVGLIYMQLIGLGLAGVSLTLILIVRRFRRRMSLTDALVPLSLLGLVLYLR